MRDSQYRRREARVSCSVVVCDDPESQSECTCVRALVSEFS